jgi:hypothetical protein
MTELGHARAVIVIWTDASIKSDWVRSEAGRAQADRKLIPVKLSHLTYKDLPPLFDVLHTENIGEEDKIRAAVAANTPRSPNLPAKGEVNHDRHHANSHKAIITILRQWWRWSSLSNLKDFTLGALGLMGAALLLVALGGQYFAF